MEQGLIGKLCYYHKNFSTLHGSNSNPFIWNFLDNSSLRRKHEKCAADENIFPHKLDVKGGVRSTMLHSLVNHTWLEKRSENVLLSVFCFSIIVSNRLCIVIWLRSKANCFFCTLPWWSLQIQTNPNPFNPIVSSSITSRHHHDLIPSYNPTLSPTFALKQQYFFTFSKWYRRQSSATQPNGGSSVTRSSSVCNWTGKVATNGKSRLAELYKHH